ncbi:alpha/beta hydrolase [Pseudooceanicola sp. HF7]|uniref:alpha/beta hydrolase n=1 Tax=Pseudooceanicola sp. HF7 TaxID=2721560 RepID=UPI0014301145|nr:alpha/beta hydrolase [Pseudooceanicola sp. HF7]NIZ07956.1 alpha/beta hydrolase [Pseudooceanicola sp. HF7]
MTKDAYHALIQPPEAGAPLVFAFHGTGGDEHQFFEITRQILPGAGVISARGDVSEQGALRFFRRTGEGVYDMEDLSRRVERMAGFVAAHKAEYPQTPVYGYGYSNGANILAAVAMKQPELFNRIGLLHPLIPWSPAPVAGLAGRRVLVTAGRRDPICPWPMTEALVTWLCDQGAEVTTEVHAGGHELQQGELTALRDLLAA